MDMHPFVASGFMWSGWDYLGEPTPYYSSRSSDMTAFPSTRRAAFSGLALVIVRAKPGQPGAIKLKAASGTLKEGVVVIKTVR